MPALPERAADEARDRRRTDDRLSADGLEGVKAAVEEIEDEATRRAFEELIRSLSKGNGRGPQR